MPTVVCRAIAARRLLEFDYGRRHRLVEPHCHGRGATNKEFFLGYQIAGTSGTGALGWRLFDLDHVYNVRLCDEGFVPRPDFRVDDTPMHPVHCSI